MIKMVVALSLTYKPTRGTRGCACSIRAPLVTWGSSTLSVPMVRNVCTLVLVVAMLGTEGGRDRGGGNS